ncbi:MAG: acetate--CoA ligase [Paracoccaceae bacterium]|tara:strand:+ start:1080 stop:3026 length:1947 start_codon:yes stop_codon:yes gene_type:complete
MKTVEGYQPKEEISNKALIDTTKYQEMYKRSVENPEAFWHEQARNLVLWQKQFSKVKNVSYSYPDVSIKWFEDGVLNVSENCIDRHLEDKSEAVAILWEGDEPGVSKEVTYRELHENVCRFGNVLKSRGIKKGDRVILYMPMVPEAAYAMLACARVGAIHSVVFAGFSPEALASRIIDCGAKAVITANEAPRGGKQTPLKKNVDEALDIAGDITALVLRRTSTEVSMKEGRDFWLNDLMDEASTVCPPEPMNAEDPLFILYTSGSTGKPKGVLHSTAGYILYASITHRFIFDYNDGDVYWCTADVGWVTGHTYIVYGPLANGATTLMFEGVPTYPDASRFWQICEKYKVNQFYTAPTAIRALMGLGDEFVNKNNLSSIRILGTVGEPINPEAWEWYNRVVGKNNCPIVDTWWQTETGGILITPLPGATTTKPGSATLPFFGIQPAILDPNSGKEITDQECEGVLVIKDSWPGQMRTVFGDHERFVSTYFNDFKGYYFTGDGCRRDKDGYYWITGRVDDVLNVSGHRMGTAEIESALVAHPKVNESAVVGFPHPIKGQGIYAYVSLMSGEKSSDELLKELQNWVRKEIGPIAKPDIIQFSPGLPKTRSGKIMRRILRKIAEDDFSNLGDTSTLAEPAVVDDLIANRKKL